MANKIFKTKFRLVTAEYDDVTMYIIERKPFLCGWKRYIIYDEPRDRLFYAVFKDKETAESHLKDKEYTTLTRRVDGKWN